MPSHSVQEIVDIVIDFLAAYQDRPVQEVYEELAARNGLAGPLRTDHGDTGARRGTLRRAYSCRRRGRALPALGVGVR